MTKRTNTSITHTAIELFAGVGGFRVGLNEVTFENGAVRERERVRFVWANQWEPSTKTQYAFDCYNTRFPSKHNSNKDICKVDKNLEIPEHTLLTGGFPCQDYSVARSLTHEKGIEGKKGVLWWQINEILVAKHPPFVLLENVDRLIKAPSKQRGRDFGIILRCFAEQGYAVEYRVINAADYGFPQRRRRTFIFAYRNTTLFYRNIIDLSPENVFKESGVFAKAFPIEKEEIKIKKTDISKKVFKDLLELQKEFAFPFENSGLMIDGIIYTAKTNPVFEKPTTLGEIIERGDVKKELFLSEKAIQKFNYLKGGKKIERTAKNGHKYYYSEGPIANPDYLDRPARTMLTSEGTVNRSTHIIDDPKTGKRRILSALECERINQFPDNWTDTMPYKKRYFMMGNALVCGIVKRIGDVIIPIMKEEK